MAYKDKEKKKAYDKEYFQRPEVKARKKARRQTPEGKAYQKEYHQRPDVKAKVKAYNQRPENKAKAKELDKWRNIKRIYSITKDEYLGQIEAQLGRCLVCEVPMEDDIHIDHCHKTGKFRGLIHRKCNIGLGMFDDDPVKLRQAAAYLER